MGDKIRDLGKDFIFFADVIMSDIHTTIEKQAQDFINGYVLAVSEKYKNVCLTYFTATNSGKKEDYAIAAETQLDRERIYTRQEDFQQIKKFREATIHDPLLKRQIELLFLSYQSRQMDEKVLEDMITLQNTIENKFATFRAEIEGKEYTDNQIEEILSNSTNTEDVQKAWLASKKIGSIVAGDVLEIVKMRNQLAQNLGYKNYHDMSLRLDEQDPDEINKIFDDLDILTRDAFIKEKSDIDEYLAKKFTIEKESLMPRHYQNRYFQEAPHIYGVDIDSYYKDQDIVELSRKYYESLGLPVEHILQVSDLYERPGKYQHAYCTSDKLGTVRILCNIKANAKWMNTQLHELGHAVYDTCIDSTHTPYILCEPAHTFTTEAIAMMFGRFASNPQWIQDMLHISEDEKQKIVDTCFRTLRLEQLVSSRWMQVMYRFEKCIYENPDQNLNDLRWDLVETYQMMKRPPQLPEAADRASKIHIACYPCYYHNYMLGELLASQLYYHIVGQVLHSTEYTFQSFYNKPEIGEYLKKNIFAVGRTYHWNTMIEMATGEKLTPKYYAQQFVQ
ncbi:MAG TPA: M3 family metallopeptidase [Candidatus Absconditabacterales bacterium]|nr:M3 family metallopeptidase [Candidatus Absconditabacterales bacterium]